MTRDTLFNLFILSCFGVLLSWVAFAYSTNLYLSCIQYTSTTQFIKENPLNQYTWRCNRILNTSKFFLCMIPYNCTSNSITFSEVQNEIIASRFQSTTSNNPLVSNSPLPFPVIR